MFFDAAFCSWLTCFFSEAVSVPPLALRSAATCRLMPFCCFSALAASPAVICPLLMPVDLFFLCRRQLATIGRAVRFGLGIERRSLGFELGSFTSRQLAAFHPLGDAILLIFFAPRPGGLGLCRRRGCGRWCCCRRVSSALRFVGLLRIQRRQVFGQR